MKKLYIKCNNNDYAGAMLSIVCTIIDNPRLIYIVKGAFNYIKLRYKIWANLNKEKVVGVVVCCVQKKEKLLRVLSDKKIDKYIVVDNKNIDKTNNLNNVNVNDYNLLIFAALNPFQVLYIDGSVTENVVLGICYKTIWNAEIKIFCGDVIIESIDDYLFEFNGENIDKKLTKQIEVCEKIWQCKKNQEFLNEKQMPHIGQNQNLSEFKRYFDEKFYLNLYPDVLESGIDPFLHYSEWGWKEGRLPTNWFDPDYYVKKNNIKLNKNINPFFHYLTEGKKLGFKTKGLNLTGASIEQKKLISKIVFDKTENGYQEFIENGSVDTVIKAIAFYLPQFHPFPENDEWWGKGFTEWTNVTKAVPNFEGHYQPHLPIHFGFYDLRVPEVLYEQAVLAKNYGIYGFNFYYYWFAGKVLMQKPFEILLENPEIDIKYCLTWANENWTRRWDGQENDVLIGQNHSDEDSYSFIHNLERYFKDPRYIRIDNKPMLVIYRPNIIPRMKHTIDLWRNEMIKMGFDGIYLVGAQTFGFEDPDLYGFDAAMEFPPHTVKSGSIRSKLSIINENFNGEIYSYDEVVSNACVAEPVDFKRYRTVMLSWDNTARKQNNSHVFADFSLLRYKQWLSNICSDVVHDNKYSNDEKIVFINAWNEWAEGTHLEPDRKFGYSYLNETYRVLKNYPFLLHNNKTKKISKANKYALVLHLHYTDIWSEIRSYLKNFDKFGFDLFITITEYDKSIVDSILKLYPGAYITTIENRGRDILPFINIYRHICDLGYDAICKIHSKKSEYREDGSEIRNRFYESLLGNEQKISKYLQILVDPSLKIGLICPQQYFIKHTVKNMTYCLSTVMDLCIFLGFEYQPLSFPAGSMYWFNPQAISGIESVESHLFEIENGFVDGTLAHAIERIIYNLIKKNGYEVYLI